MAITVKSYTKHFNGKLVTVHGYAAERNAAHELRHPAHTVVTRQFVARGGEMGIPSPGQYMNPNDARLGEAGLTSYFFHSGGRAEKQPVVRWRRTILPIKGTYNTSRKGL